VKYKKTFTPIVLTVLLYLVFPLVAGLLAIGDRDGPKIYPPFYHEQLYMISSESVWHEKPRQNFEFERPWFYGLPRQRRVQLQR
jgi:hypothetical protein